MSTDYNMTTLVNEAKKGDAAAFSKLYEVIYKDLFHFAYYTLRNRQEAEDAVSEATLSAYEHIQSLRKASAFRGWIFRILINCCNQIAKHRSLLVDTYESTQAIDPDYATNAALAQAYNGLDARERYVVSLILFAGYTSKEIATMLHLKPGTVRSIKSRALDKMKEALS